MSRFRSVDTVQNQDSTHEDLNSTLPERHDRIENQYGARQPRESYPRFECLGLQHQQQQIHYDSPQYEDNTIYKETCKLLRGPDLFIKKYFAKDLTELAERLQVKLVMDEERMGIQVEGRQRNIREVLEAYTMFGKGIEFREKIIEVTNHKKLLDSKKGSEILKTIEGQIRCIILREQDLKEEKGFPCTFIIDNTTIKVRQVDITTLSVDAIVSVTDGYLQLLGYQAECTITDIANLSCQNIIQVYSALFWSEISEIIDEVLDKVMENGFQTVAIDTGIIHGLYPLHFATDRMVESIASYINDYKSSFLTTIYLVDIKDKYLYSTVRSLQSSREFKQVEFDQPQYDSLPTQLLKTELGKGPIVHGEMGSPYFEDPVSEASTKDVSLSFYSDDIDEIKKAMKQLDKSFQRDIQEIKLSLGITLTDVQKAIILSYEELYSVNVNIDEGSSSIVIRGLMADINEVNNAIIGILRNALTEKHEAKYSDVLKDVIQWSWLENGQRKIYSKYANTKIEEAFVSNDSNFTLKYTEQRFTFNFVNMEVTDKDGNTSPLLRQDKIKEATAATGLPINWTIPMDTNLNILQLHPDSTEYNQVVNNFQANLGRQNIPIVKIERIENRSLYQQYMAQKKHRIKT